MTLTPPKDLITRPATMDDLEAAVDLFNACAIEQIGRPTWDLNDAATEWTSPLLNQETDTLVVLSPDGKLVGYVEAWDEAPHVRLFVSARVHPGSTGQGIGTFLLRWSERRAQRAIPKAPAGARVVIHQELLSTEAKAHQLLEANGYKPIRHALRMVIEMDTPPPEPALPPGITIRAFVPGEERRVLEAVDEAFRDHWGYVETPFEQMYEDLLHWMEKDADHDPTLWFLAMDGDEIAGASLCHPKIVEDPEMGFVFTLGVRRPWRRRGIALALLQHSFGALFRRGKRKVGLGVDAQSLTGATRLYERAGMHADRRYTTFEKELRAGKDLSTQTLEH